MAAASAWISSSRSPAARARHHRHAGGDHRVARADLVAHQAHRFGGWSDEDDTCVDHRLRKVVVLSQEAIAGMDGVGACLLGHIDDLVDAQIALGRAGRRPDAGTPRLA
jgi:hypothetical protein